MCPADSSEVYGNTRQGAMSVRARYKKSGLYPNDGGSVPYWTVSWYAFPQTVALSHTGEYIAVESPLDPDWSCDLVFYVQNRLAKSWKIAEVDPGALKRAAANEDRKTSHKTCCGYQSFLGLEAARISRDGRMELETSGGFVAFNMHSGELLSRALRAKSETNFPANVREYEAFCRALGTTGTRNPNFISGLPEPEFELVPIPRPRRAQPRAAIAPYDPYRFVSPPLAADPIDWHLYLAAATALSYALCFCAIRMRSRKS